MRNIEACYFEASKCYKASEPRSGAIEAANASSSLAGPPAVERYQKRRYQEHVRAPVDIFACGAIRWLLAPSSEGERGGAGLEGVSARGDLLRSEMSRSRRLILSIYRGSSLTQLFIRRECRLRSRGGALSLSPARSQARTRGEATGRRRRKRRRGGGADCAIRLDSPLGTRARVANEQMTSRQGARRSPFRQGITRPAADNER
jgi:hypothetical protein